MFDNFMEYLIAIIAILSIFAGPFIAIVVVLLKFNSSRNKERMAMISQGIIPQEATSKRSTPNRLRSLRTALGSIGAGIGVVIGIILNNYVLLELGRFEKLAVIIGTAFFFFGIGYVIYFIISKDKIKSEDSEEFEELEVE